jgi:hypothetical protein
MAETDSQTSFIDEEPKAVDFALDEEKKEHPAFLVRLLLRRGLVKTDAQALTLLVVLTTCSVALTGLIAIKTLYQPSYDNTPISKIPVHVVNKLPFDAQRQLREQRP